MHAKQMRIVVGDLKPKLPTETTNFLFKVILQMYLCNILARHQFLTWSERTFSEQKYTFNHSLVLADIYYYGMLAHGEK